MGGDWDDAGRRFVEHFKTYGGLEPDERVLDVGCGAGRIAVALGPYLGSGGSYEGLDLYRPAIKWCSGHITPRWPNFRFQHADVKEDLNNPGGSIAAERYRFPYEDETFDFVFLTSVFTHLLPPAAGHYLSEIHRVLRPGGRCLATWFLLDGQSWPAVRAGTTQYGFGIDREGCRIARLDMPLMAVAYPRELVGTMVADAQLDVREPVIRGNWYGDRSAPEHQDLLVIDRA